MPEPTFPATRRGLLAFGASSALALLAGVPRSARAQTEAVRRLIVGYPAGGLTDRLGRIIAESLSQASSARYIVENRPGADGMVATEMASRAEGDGRTLLLQSVDALAMEMALRNDPTFDPFRSLAVVAPIARFEFLVAANAKLGLRSLSDLIELGRRSPSAVFYVDTGSSARTLFENLKKKYGLTLIGVPYRGMAPAMPDLLEGRVGLAMLDGALAVAHAASGKLTILGRADAVGTRDATRAPTLVEQGAAGLWVDTRLAMMAPMSMPTETMEPLRALLTTTLKKPSVRVQLEQGAFHPIDADPDRFARSVTESVEHYRHLARQAGLL